MGRKKYSIDKDVFKHIDQPWKAYFLGWLYADGSITKSARQINLVLAEEDRGVLEFFASKLYAGAAPMSYRKPFLFKAPTNGKIYTSQPQHGLHIYRNEVASDLLEKGLIPAKSLITTFPTAKAVPDCFMSHFIRGYFEGDGTIGDPSKRGGGKMSILGSAMFLTGLREKLFEHDIHTLPPHPTSSNIWMMEISTREHVCRFANLIYRDADYALSRKKVRFDRLFDRRDDAHRRNRTARFIGVNMASNTDRYMARAMIDGKRHFIGHYETEEAAREARAVFLEQRGLHTRRAA